MVEPVFLLLFVLIILAAVIAYFFKRNRKLKRMGLQDQIEEMFR